MKKKAKLLDFISSKIDIITEAFKFFVNGEWIYDVYNSQSMHHALSEEEQELYNFDLKKLCWEEYAHIFAYGLYTRFLDGDPDPHYDPRNYLVTYRELTFSDSHWAYTHGAAGQKIVEAAEMKTFLLNTDKVKAVMRDLAKQNVTPSISEEKAYKLQLRRAVEVVDTMTARMNKRTIKYFAWFLRKIWKTMYDQIVINSTQLDHIKKLMESKSGNIILCPTHRSYMDFLIVSYIMFAFKMDMPHICAGDDFLNITFVHHILRRSGAFFMKRSFRDDLLYKAIFHTYVSKLLGDGGSFEFFVEGTRARTGKMLKPKLGLLGILLDNYYEGNVENLHFVPVAINYSRVLEGETFPGELLGEPKIKESMGRMLKAINTLRMNFGTINVEFGEVIDFQEYEQKVIVEKGWNPVEIKSERKQLVEHMGYDLVHLLCKSLTIMPTAICATVLLNQRKGISGAQLLEQIDWLVHELQLREAKLPNKELASKYIKKIGIYHLNDAVQKNKDIMYPRVKPSIDYKNILLLGYYKNGLIHVFINECFVAGSLYGFGVGPCFTEGVRREDLAEKTLTLAKFLEDDFVLETRIDSKERFDDLIAKMIHHGTVEETPEGLIRVPLVGRRMFNFLCNLIWPLIDSYWLTFVYAFSLLPNYFCEEKFLYDFISSFAEKLHEDKIISFFESCSLETIKNAVNIYLVSSV